MTRNKWLVIGGLIIAVPVISGLIVAVLYVVWKFGSQQPESSLRDAIPTLVEATVEVPINQAVMIGMESESFTFSPGEVSLFIPANALNRKGQISITQKEADLLAEAGDPGWRRPYVYNVEITDSLGLELDAVVNNFVEVCFMMDEALWTDYQNSPGIFQLQLYDESQSPPRWESLAMNVYPDRHQVCGKTSHFSLFSLAYQEPATPTFEPGSSGEMIETETPGVYEP